MRKAFAVGALLLPVPFAALPLFSLLFTPTSDDDSPVDDQVALHAGTQLDLPAQASLAYGRSEPSHLDCDKTANSLGES